MTDQIKKEELDKVSGGYGEALYTCSICNLGFYNPGALMQYNAHMKRHVKAENH